MLIEWCLHLEKSVLMWGSHERPIWLSLKEKLSSNLALSAIELLFVFYLLYFLLYILTCSGPGLKRKTLYLLFFKGPEKLPANRV